MSNRMQEVMFDIDEYAAEKMSKRMDELEAKGELTQDILRAVQRLNDDEATDEDCLILIGLLGVSPAKIKYRASDN